LPTEEIWLDDSTVLAKWKRPLTERDIAASFKQVAEMLDKVIATTHVLLEVSEAGVIPPSAPRMAIRSGLLTKPYIGNVAMVGEVQAESLTKAMFQIATSSTGKEIMFFTFIVDALAYLDDTTHSERPNNHR
jgi:hypothetical protein